MFRDAHVLLLSPAGVAAAAAGAGALPLADCGPASGHHALVDPRLGPTPNRRPAFAASLFWSAAFYWAHAGSCGVAVWDDDYRAVGAALARYAGATGGVVRGCAGCHRRTAMDGGSGAALSSCAACRAVFYCGRECQLHHWRTGHKAECPGAAAKGGKA